MSRPQTPQTPVQPEHSTLQARPVSPCFTPGTRIVTAAGEVAVEDLRPGDKVVTRDSGLQEIAWVGRRALSWADLAANPQLKPVFLAKGSLGRGLPERDMMLSPDHRLLVDHDRSAALFREREVLVAARHLGAAQGNPSVDVTGIEYLHFMFDRHQIVLSDGVWTESFQPSDRVMHGMDESQRGEILKLFPDLASRKVLARFTAARRVLTRRELSLMAS